MSKLPKKTLVTSSFLLLVELLVEFLLLVAMPFVTRSFKTQLFSAALVAVNPVAEMRTEKYANP